MRKSCFLKLASFNGRGSYHLVIVIRNSSAKSNHTKRHLLKKQLKIMLPTRYQQITVFQLLVCFDVLSFFLNLGLIFSDCHTHSWDFSIHLSLQTKKLLTYLYINRKRFKKVISREWIQNLKDHFPQKSIYYNYQRNLDWVYFRSKRSR